MASLSGSVVGPIVDGLGTKSAGTVSAQAQDGVDFAIGPLGFRLASTDQNPYQRATAQFRKDQYDAAPTPGDQSLTGWWTRSQMSFHHGAGVKYYEVLEGESVLNRFWDSDAIDPRKPGLVTMLPELGLVNSGTFRQVTDNRVGRSSPLAGVTTADTAATINGTTTTALTPSTATTVYAVASGGGNTFYATGNGIEQIPATGTTLSLISAKDATVAKPEHVGVWWAKNRIWTVNGSGEWHAVAATGGAIGSTTRVWQSGMDSVRGDWSLASGPSAVFVGKGSGIYALSVNSDGTVPVVTGGVTVAELPNDEKVQALGYTLGYLIVGTNKGIRVAVTQGTDVVLGPLLTEASATSVAVVGATVLVGTATRLVAIDLTQPISELVFSWFDWTDRAGDVMATSSGRYLLTGAGIYTVPTSGNYAPVATLTTGFMRFGTLEPKSFHSVRLRVGGTGGSVTVSRVDQDGTETTLVTIDPLNFSNAPITLRTAGPQEALGLKFTLNRDSVDPTKAPTLLGYQLFAQPAPRRVRLIRVPLVIQDTVRDRHGVDRGRRSQAWAMYSALEDLESQTSMVQFKDYRTGESGSAYIDEVEFRADTPPSQDQQSFGGVAYVTLRKVS